jgi:6-pyruvoyltetrahydropterin/6-carboxytetrahydropterin synthase
MYTLAVEKDISMAHQLNDYQGPCARIHGHNWKFRIECNAEHLDELGIAIDFIDIEKWLEEILNPFDHNLINLIPPFDKTNPTAENLVKYVFEEMKTKLPDTIELRRVSAWETESCMVSYEE